MEKSFAPLEGKTSVVLTVEELKSKWIDICIEQSRPEDMDSFSIASVLPLVVRENELVELVNRTAEAIESSLLHDDSAIEYITEQELARLWKESSLLPMGKSANAFDCKSALLLLRDEEDASLMGEDSVAVADQERAKVTISDSELALRDSMAKQAQVLRQAEQAALDSIEMRRQGAGVDAADAGEVDEGVEFVITVDELKRLWDERAKVRFGMAGPEFSEKAALLLIDDDDEDDDTEYVSALHQDDDEEERNGFWNEYTGREGQFMRENLKALHDDLEDMTTRRPAWKKDRHILTPDIDTQEFMGDLMWSNTYMTQRVPANWDDPEAEEMSDTYHSTSTMAWPGEEETDFNFRPPPWELLNLPIGPNAAKFARENSDDEEGAESPEEPAAAVDASGNDVDWATFDFAADEAKEAKQAKAADAGAGSGAGDVIDVESFFKKLGAGGGEEGAEVEGVDGLADELEEVDMVAAKPMGRTADYTTLISRGWRTPPSWLTQPAFADHVGFEVWSKQPEEEYHAGDDSLWDEDEWTAESIEHVMEVTDLYLTDHGALSRKMDERKHWERAMNRVLGGELDCDIEDIPMTLTPDKERGVVYGDELIEMKGKMTLHVFQEPPAVMFANDSFTHNTEFVTMNKIGTMREQYEWAPTVPPEEWLIEEHKLAAIRPVLDYANHLVHLQSTRDDVLIFRYEGQMRHVMGIRDNMLAVAAELCPGKIKDIRLETTRQTDKYDR